MLLRRGLPRTAQREGISVSGWIAKKTDIYQGSIEAYIAFLSRTKNRLLIVENTSESIEKKSEGKHLQELFRIFDWNSSVKTRLQPIQSKDQFIEALNEAKEWQIHVSSHGIFCKKSKTANIQIPHGSEVCAEDLSNLWANRPAEKKPRLIVLSACETGRPDLAKAFYEAGCRYFIAPLDEVPWIDAAIFNTLFYNYLFVDRMSVWGANRKTITISPKLAGRYRFYDKGIRYWNG